MVPNHFSMVSLPHGAPVSVNPMPCTTNKPKSAGHPAIQRAKCCKTVRGQYGTRLGNERVPGYRRKKACSKVKTETFVRFKFMIDNCAGPTAIYSRTGKRLAARHTELQIQFRRAPLVLSRLRQSKAWNQSMVFTCSDEAFHCVGAKIPGAQMRVGQLE